MEPSTDTDITYLITPPSVATMAPLAAGGVEMLRTPEEWVLRWVWLFPFERGDLRHYWWHQLEGLHGDFAIEGPSSPAMKRFLSKHDPDGRHRECRVRSR